MDKLKDEKQMSSTKYIFTTKYCIRYMSKCTWKSVKDDYVDRTQHIV